MGGSALDQEQEGIGPLGGEAREEFFPIGEDVHVVWGHGSR
jgi:hypothetical protein